MVYSGKTRFTMTKIKQNNKQQIKKKIDRIILRMVFDESHISYWDGCVPEIMEVIEEDRKELIGEIEKMRRIILSIEEYDKAKAIGAEQLIKETNLVSSGFNQALDDILKSLKEKDE